MADVDVIVVNYRTGPESVATAQRVAGADVEVWLVDNSGEILADPPSGLRVLGDGHNAMYAPASNLAYAQGSAPYVLLLNPDVTLVPTQLAALREALQADEALWAVAPTLTSVQGPTRPYLRRLPTTVSLLADLVPPLRPVFRSSYRRYLCLDEPAGADALVDQPAAACLLVRRDRVGPGLFDEQYRLFFNDTDLSRRMREAGWSCRHLASVRAPHVGGASIALERERSGTWVSDEYDRAALRYARANLRLTWLFAAVVSVRRVLRAARGAPAARLARRGAHPA